MPVTDAAVVLRPARDHDAGQIARIWCTGWADGHLGHVPEALRAHRTLPEFKRRSIDRVHATTVAVTTSGDVRQVAGFVVVRGDEIEQLYVDAAWRGAGIARSLIDHAERQVAELHTTAWLAVVDGNTRARRFYERCGWRDRGPFENPAETSDGSMLVPCRRYEKRVRTGTGDVR
ncbi:MAG: GNAT family N-acetyltransferase [Ilumatobacteraceae bacterium]